MNWSIDAAATEFSVDRRTLAKRLKDTGHDTGRGIKFTTLQIHSALDRRPEKMLLLDAEQARLASEKADEVAMRNAARRRELLDLHQFCRRADPIVTGIIARIESSGLPATDKDALRDQIAKLCDVDFLKGQ